ncbi:MAG: hypothetical protein RLY20_1013 [Verrucomicrobiota bacterium]|jgi:hypothetical protein
MADIFCHTEEPSNHGGESTDLMAESSCHGGESFYLTEKPFCHGEKWFFAALPARCHARRSFYFNALYEFETDRPVSGPFRVPKQNQCNKRQIMPKIDLIKSNDDAFAAQMGTFKNNIGGYATILGLPAQQVTDQAADTDYLMHSLACQKIVANAAQQWTAWKGIIRSGGVIPAAGAPVLPNLPPVVPVVAPGIEARFRALVKQIKAHKNYNVAMGEALGIEGAEQVAPDMSTVQPNLKVRLSGGRVEVDWGWQGNSAYLDLCELQVDRGDGKGFGLLAFDSTPGYVDTAPLPAAPAKWTYRAIYRVDDAQVGQWSNPVSLTVGG